jgi:hypothetical protein
MSRGLGKLQRDLLETLEENNKSIDTLTLAALVYDVQPDANGVHRINNAQHTAVRRAMRNLHKRGLVVDLERPHSDARRYWASIKAGLPARLHYLRIFHPRAPEIAAIQERMKQLGISPTR